MLYNGAAGYQSDSATGLQLLGHRYYDPSIGRFLSSDPAQAGTNWYAYCDNNPLVREDPSGLFNWGAATGSVLAGIGGFIIGGPIGAAVAVGIWGGVYDYASGDTVGGAIAHGVVAGGVAYVGGLVLQKVVSAIWDGLWPVQVLPESPPGYCQPVHYTTPDNLPGIIQTGQVNPSGPGLGNLSGGGTYAWPNPLTNPSGFPNSALGGGSNATVPVTISVPISSVSRGAFGSVIINGPGTLYNPGNLLN